VSRPVSLTLYAAAAALLEPFAPAFLASRARGGKEDQQRMGERLGHASGPRPAGPLVWLHAVSVGESVSLLPLIDRLAVERPGLALLVTSGTLASAQVLAQRLPARAIHQYAPLDTPRAVERFLDHWRPAVGLFVESELWPNLILGARERGTRLALVSARMTEKSARAWRRRPAASRAVLGAFELILAQDNAIEARLGRLGGRVGGRLNLKRLGAPLGADAGEVARLKDAVRGRRVVLALSTHAPEERLIASAMQPLSAEPLLIIAPRHPVRGPEIARSFAGDRLARRSAGEPIAPRTGIYLADTLGEVGLWLQLAHVAVVGGSFGRGVGGHNPLEPARLGVPVVTGPDVANFADIYAEMIAAGAALQAHDEAGLTAVLAGLLEDEARRVRVSEAALAFAALQADQLDHALAAIAPLLPA
jgi:3-deoxy-D-manno-octulosonic-acid transferase